MEEFEYTNMENDTKYLINLAIKLRNNCLKIALDAGRNGAHLGGGLSLVEVFAVLYGSVLKFDSENLFDENRDRLIVSKGHCVLPYYSVLNEFGFIADEELQKFETNGAVLHGHATRDLTYGVEFSGGSLGMGLSFAVGVALAGKLNKKDYKVYAIIGDGELNEGIVWEALMSASHFALDNLVVIVDNNKLQYDGASSAIMNMDDLRKKFEAFGAVVKEVDGHSTSELVQVFQTTVPAKPMVIIAHTVKGKGVSFMENKKEWHHSVLTQTQYEQAMSEQPQYLQ